MNRFIAMTLSILAFASCKKSDRIPKAEHELISTIEKMELNNGENLLMPSTPALLMAPGEQAEVHFRQLTSDPFDSLPGQLMFSSSDPSVAMLSADGKVIAKQTGVTTLTATNSTAKKTVIQVAVQSGGL